MSRPINTLKTEIILLGMEPVKERLFTLLKAKSSLIKFLFTKEMNETTLKRVHEDEEIIRETLGFVAAAESSIESLSEENQELRLKLLKEKEITEYWHQCYRKEHQDFITTIDAITGNGSK